ncbi:MAG: hypothetical protein MUF18_21705 [Fimbriiglobus sp.]|jgi:hypothetical protein|nr:hypothetical protein [Fimbriiglobus sp.]
MRRTYKTWYLLGGLFVGVPIVVLGGAFALLMTQYSFGPRTLAPQNMVMEYDGPGALKHQPGPTAASPDPSDDASNK